MLSIEPAPQKLFRSGRLRIEEAQSPPQAAGATGSQPQPKLSEEACELSIKSPHQVVATEPLRIPAGLAQA